MTSGEILFDGQPIQMIAYKRRMGYVPEEPHLYSHLSGLEYLTMVGQLRELPAKSTADKIDGLLRFFSLHGDRHSPISNYSKGMRQKILLAAALLHDPDLILLDERKRAMAKRPVRAAPWECKTSANNCETECRGVPALLAWPLLTKAMLS